MKKILYIMAISLIAGAGSSCKKIDNYDAPNTTLNGSVVDATTGEGIQTETGNNGTRIKLLEISWSATPDPYYVSSMQDGTFNNTKLFAGKDVISAEGPFVPLVQQDATGKTIVDKSQTVDLKGTTTLKFSVEPFLKIAWAGDPVFNTADGTITAKFIVTRGTADPNFQLNVRDINMYISPTKYAGDNNYDDHHSTRVAYADAAGNALLGQTLSFSTIGGVLPGKRSYFVRIAARISYGLNYFNYTDVKEVVAP